MRILIRYAFLFVLIACNTHPSDSKDRLPVDTMKVLLWDLLKADELFLHQSNKDSTLLAKQANIRLYKEVLAMHNISKEIFDTSWYYYQSHPMQLKELMDSLDALAGRERNRIDSKYGHSDTTHNPRR